MRDYLAEQLICLTELLLRSLADGVSTVSDLMTIVQAAGATALALPLSAISLGGLVIKFLYGTYQRLYVHLMSQEYCWLIPL